MLGKFKSQNLSHMCSSYSPLKSSIEPSLQSLNKCKILLAPREIENIFTSNVWSIYFMINLLVSRLIGIYAQYDIFIHCNQQRRGEKHKRICIQARKWMESMPSNLWLEYECTCHYRSIHCENQNAQSSHNHHAHNASDPSNEPSWSLTQNCFWYCLWSPCTKHGHHIFYPCFAFVKSYERLEVMMAIWKKHLHRKQLAKIGLFE